MKVVSEEENNSRRLLDDQPIEPGRMYKRLLYTIGVPCGDSYRVFNTLTGVVVELNPEEYEKFISLPTEYAPWMDELINRWFIVTEDTDDLDELKSLKEFCRKYILPKREKQYIILPTSACNARCYYCFEYGAVHKTMTEQTADDVIKFILKDKHRKPVEISWFGGEPLVGEKIIDRICTGLKAHGLEVVSVMTSNGYLFTQEMVDKAAELWNLEAIQITIDGTEDVYNRTKDYVAVPEGISPYKRVLGNIEMLLEAGIKVTIRINVGKENINDMERLVVELKKRYENNPLVRVCPYTIFENCGAEPTVYKPGEIELIDEKCKEIGRSLGRLNGKRPSVLPMLRVANCMADNPSVVLINPDGDLGGCEHFVYEELYGNIYEGIVNEEAYNKWAEKKVLPVCETCPLLPTCGMHNYCPLDRECNDSLRQEKMSMVIEAIKKAE